MDGSNKLTITKLALYPFLPDAATHVKNQDYDITEIFTSPGFETIIQASMDNIRAAIQGDFTREITDDTVESEIQLLTYPITRILLSCIDNHYLTQRYAIAESKAASKNLKKEDSQIIKTIAESLDFNPAIQKDYFSIPFTDYVQVSHTIKELKWKLINQKLIKGQILLDKDSFTRLIEEKIKQKILNKMPLSIPEEHCKNLARQVEEIKTTFKEKQKHTQDKELGPINREYFPPCITHAITNVQAGVNLGHSTRFALTSFLITIGMDTESILRLFAVSPDFDVEKTRYQIEHIAGSSGTNYTPPSCATMETFGNCIGKNRLCEKISHPIGYYRKKAWLERKDKKAKQEKKSPKNHG